MYFSATLLLLTILFMIMVIVSRAETTIIILAVIAFALGFLGCSSSWLAWLAAGAGWVVLGACHEH